MKPKSIEKATHADGKLHVIYKGPTGGLTVGSMLFPHGVETRLSITKIDQIPDEIWSALTIVRPGK